MTYIITTVNCLKCLVSCEPHNYQKLLHPNITGDVRAKTPIHRFLLPISLQPQISFSTACVYELSCFSLDLIHTHALSSPSLSPFLCHTSSPLLHTHAFLSVPMLLTEIWRHNSFHCKASKPPQNDYLTPSPSEHHQLIYGVLFLPQFLSLFSVSLYSSYSSSFVLFTLSFSFQKELWRKYFSNNFLWIIYVT